MEEYPITVVCPGRRPRNEILEWVHANSL